MYHHHITRAIAEAHAADLQRTAARNRPTAPVRPRHRRRAIVAALVAICALAPTAGALAKPADSVIAKRPSHDEQITRADVRATPSMITFTNPLRRSRGPGAGAGLL